MASIIVAIVIIIIVTIIIVTIIIVTLSKSNSVSSLFHSAFAAATAALEDDIQV